MSVLFTRYTLELAHSAPPPSLLPPPLPGGGGGSGGGGGGWDGSYDAAVSYTTPPYSAYTYEGVDTGGRAKNGHVVIMPMDELSTGSLALNGTLKTVVVSYDYYEPEELDTASRALNGTLRTTQLEYDMRPESLDTGSRALNGTLKAVLMAYINYIPEELDAASFALDGTLT